MTTWRDRLARKLRRAGDGIRGVLDACDDEARAEEARALFACEACGGVACRRELTPDPPALATDRSPALPLKCGSSVRWLPHFIEAFEPAVNHALARFWKHRERPRAWTRQLEMDLAADILRAVEGVVDDWITEAIDERE